jgi:hypothetical protein
MGIDAVILWNDRTEQVDEEIAREIIKRSQAKARETGLDPSLVTELNIPEMGRLRERYGMYYHFLLIFFREAYDSTATAMNNKAGYGECHISSMALEWRIREALYDLIYATPPDRRRDIMHKKYVLKHDPSKEMVKFMAKQGATSTISKDDTIIDHVMDICAEQMAGLTMINQTNEAITAPCISLFWSFDNHMASLFTEQQNNIQKIILGH